MPNFALILHLLVDSIIRNSAILMEALEDHRTLSREEIDKLWWNLLPDTLSDKQKKAKVGNMLTKMREEGDIENTTVGNVSIWSLLKSKN